MPVSAYPVPPPPRPSVQKKKLYTSRSTAPDKNTFKAASYNIEHGIFTKESEIEELIVNEQLDNIFLCEVDNTNVDESYKLLDFKAVIPELKAPNNKTRIIALILDG